jgi:hypothetical protein
MRRVLLAIMAAGWPASLLGQADIRADAMFATRHAWRGVNRITGWTLQMELDASARLGPGALGLGVVQIQEPFRAERGDLNEAGRGRGGPAERNWWAEYRLPVGELDLSAGFVRFTYHGHSSRGGVSAEDDTGELYAAVEARRTYLSPALSAYWDIDRVRGAYLEASGRLPLLGWPFPPEVFAYLDGALGFAVGEDPDPSRPGDLFYYRGDGPTHVRLGLAVDVKRTPNLALGGGIRGTVGLDDAARLGADDRLHDVFFTLWIGATFGARLPDR